MAVNGDVVRQIVREELERAMSGVGQLADKLDPAGDVARGRVLSVEEAAAFLGGLPESTVRKLAQKRQLGFVKIGRTTAFPVGALNDYIEKHTLAPIENPWGLTDGGLRTIREGSPQDRVRRRTEAMHRLLPRD